MTSALLLPTLTADRLAVLAEALAEPDGGFSVRPNTGRPVRTGYAVSVHPECERQISGTVTVDDLCAFMIVNADALAEPGAVLGGWRDPASGVAYLDVSRVVAHRFVALQLAAEYGQLAVYDFAAGQSIPVADAGPLAA